MHLPDIKVAIPLIFVLWCVAGLLTKGPVMLMYPAMWGIVGLFFLIVHFLVKAPDDQQTST